LTFSHFFSIEDLPVFHFSGGLKTYCTFRCISFYWVVSWGSPYL